MSLNKMYTNLGPKMGQFGKFALPMTFSKFKTRDVVINTRKPDHTTIFDVSHMGVYESFNYSTNSLKIDELLNIKSKKISNNKSKLSVILNKDGIVIDDLIIGNIENSKYRLVTNANNDDFFDNFDYLNKKDKTILALQGPGSQKLLEDISSTSLSDLYFMENKTIINEEFEICRCGYTGEDGFELYMNKDIGMEVIDKLVRLSLNENNGVSFGGLIERDILRQEAGLCLSGVEFSESMDVKFNALGMRFLIDIIYRKNPIYNSYLQLTKFIGTKPIKKEVITNKQNKNIGIITSSTKSFNLNKFIGLGYLKKTSANDICFNNGNIIQVHDGNFIEPQYYKSN
jgi:aminomethyltransferase